MNVGDVIDRVLHKFGDEANVQITESAIIRYINDGQREIAYQNEVLQAVGTMDITAGEYSYTIPPDLLTLRTMYLNGRRVKFIEKTEYDEYIGDYDPARTDTATPLVYTRWANTFYLYPVPVADAPEGLRIEYTQRPVEVISRNDELQLPLEYHNLLVDYCMTQAYETDEAWDAVGYKNQQFADNMQRLSATKNTDNEYYATITVLPEDM